MYHSPGVPGLQTTKAMNSRFENFKEEFKKDRESFREQLRGNGSFEFLTCVELLVSLEFKMNNRLLVYLFGDTLGLHYASKFAEHRNVIKLISDMGDNERMFILHELKTNESLFMNC